ncbi:MAG TPA: VIT1/CCC1 transporter family protein [Polyangiaceae bacterium]
MSSSLPGKPASGFGHYLRDVVYGALDGVVTTLAVVSGSAGAMLDPRIGLILGLANLAADGVSMGASNYFALKSELAQLGLPSATEQPWRHGLATTAAFVVAGTVPLLAYFVPRPASVSVLEIALVLSALTLSYAGAVRAAFVGQSRWRSAGEMLAIGAAACSVAYAIGVIAERVLR